MKTPTQLGGLKLEVSGEAQRVTTPVHIDQFSLARKAASKPRCQSSYSSNYIVKGLPDCFLNKDNKHRQSKERRPQSTVKFADGKQPVADETRRKRPITSMHFVPKAPPKILTPSNHSTLDLPHEIMPHNFWYKPQSNLGNHFDPVPPEQMQRPSLATSNLPHLDGQASQPSAFCRAAQG